MRARARACRRYRAVAVCAKKAVKKVQVVLKSEVAQVGRKGDLVTVRRGGCACYEASHAWLGATRQPPARRHAAPSLVSRVRSVLGMHAGRCACVLARSDAAAAAA